jgi:CheY-like chemotaxis protein
MNSSGFGAKDRSSAHAKNQAPDLRRDLLALEAEARTLRPMATVLIIEDQPSARALMRSILEAGGHTVVEARNGREAMRVPMKPYDLVITDILMPDMDGLEVLRRIKRGHCDPLRRDLPVLVVSSGWANPNSDLLSVARALGADRTLSKSEIQSELLATVADMLH